MIKPETCILRLPTDLKQRLERQAEREALSLNQWALYNLSQSVAFTEAYRELQSRLSRTDMVRAKETAWRLLTRPTRGGPPGVGRRSPRLEGVRTRTPIGHSAKRASSPEGGPSQGPPGPEIAGGRSCCGCLRVRASGTTAPRL